MKQKKGFTLIELLVVIAIIGVLSAIGLVSYQAANSKARDSRREADVQQLRSALEMYKTDNDEYPDNITTDLSLYLSGKTVQDPKNSGDYVYSYESDGSTYTITYTLENGGQQSIENP